MAVKIVSIALDIQGTEEEVAQALEYIQNQEWYAGHNIVNEETLEANDPRVNPDSEDI